MLFLRGKKALITILALSLCLRALPAELLVYNNNDGGPGSLRQAVIDNNTSAGGNTIAFSNIVTGAITLTNGELFIARPVIIAGPGPGILAVNGNAASRVFHISNAVTAFISGLTITNGAVTGSFPDNVGGGIWNDHSRLILSNCVVSGNSGGVGPGGGIYNNGSSDIGTFLRIIASTVSGNSASNHGGGIYNDGFASSGSTVEIIASTISGNAAKGTGAVGGGIWNDGNFGSATLGIWDSTFSGNSAVQNGGGIYNSGAGGIFLTTLSVTASTFSDNSAAVGGGIYNNSGGATVTFRGTILKTGASGANIANLGGTIYTDGYNLSSDNGSGYLINTTDRISTNPLLGPLADNGGPTLTHALLPGSPAIDKGYSFGLMTDQRGEPRQVDFSSITNASGGDGSDIGAFEVGRPKLDIEHVGSNAILSWLAYSADFILQTSTNITASNSWITAGGAAALVGDQYRQTNSPISDNRFFRLRGN